MAASYEEHLIVSAARNEKPIPEEVWKALVAMEAELRKIDMTK